MEIQKNCSRLVQSAILLIESDFLYLFGIEDLASQLGVTNCHLIREFKKHLDISPLKVLTNTRIEQSKILLATTNLSVDNIAMAVGFSCGNYFSKVFKKETGLTPKEFASSSPITSTKLKNDQIYL